MIVTKPGVTWSFSCDYDTEYEVGQDLTVNAASISQGFSQTNAQFAFAFDFYTDGSFEDIQDTAEYSVGQHINFGGTFSVLLVELGVAGFPVGVIYYFQ